MEVFNSLNLYALSVHKEALCELFECCGFIIFCCLYSYPALNNKYFHRYIYIVFLQVLLHERLLKNFSVFRLVSLTVFVLILSRFV